MLRWYMMDVRARFVPLYWLKVAENGHLLTFYDNPPFEQLFSESLSDPVFIREREWWAGMDSNH